MRTPEESELRARGLLPFQAEFVALVLDVDRGRRVVASIPSGVGTRAMTAEVIRQLRDQISDCRVLIVAQPSLMPAWVAAVEESLRSPVRSLNPVALRVLEADTTSLANPWSAVQFAVVGAESLRNQQRLDHVLSLPWTLIVIDDIRASPGTQREATVRAFWESRMSGRVLYLSPAPLAGTVTTWSDLAPSAAFAISPAEITNWEGEPLLADRELRRVSVDYTAAEMAVFDAVKRLSVAADGEPQSGSTRGTSSLSAIEQSLRRTLLHDGELGDFSTTQEDPGPTSGTGRLDIRLGNESPGTLGLLLSQLELLPVDSKFAVCLDLLRSCFAQGDELGVIFTEYAATAEYLASQLEDMELPAAVLSEEVLPRERELVVRDGLGPRPLTVIVTAGSLDGLDLHNADFCIHYDVPVDPMAMEQRIGRVDRFSRTKPPAKQFILDDR
jgi:hypothetical protein